MVGKIRYSCAKFKAEIPNLNIITTVEWISMVFAIFTIIYLATVFSCYMYVYM